MKVTLSIDRRQLKALENELEGKAKRLRRENEIAINATAKAVERELAGPKQGIRSELSVNAKDARDAITRTRATRARDYATVTVEKEKRLPLRAFRPRELKRGGVSYKTSPKTGTRRVTDAFIPGSGRHVMKRRGASRYPLSVLHAASPWGAVKKKGIKARMIRFGKSRLKKEVSKRLTFLRKKRAGVI